MKSMNALWQWNHPLWSLLAGVLLGVAVTAADCSAAEPWKTGDKVLFGSYVVLSAIDGAQTDRGIKSGQYHETNPILGEYPSTARIALTKLVSAGLVYLLADHFSDSRRTILVVINALQIGIVAHNASIGLKVGF
jgi:hypothetical protein